MVVRHNGKSNKYDGSVKRVSGRDAACGWAVVQIDYDKVEEPRCAIYGTMLAELELQRTINRRELWGFTHHGVGRLDCFFHHPHG